MTGSGFSGRQLLSAAHCGGDTRFHAGEQFGEVRAEKEQGRVDAERIDIDSPFAGRPWIFVTQAEKAREVFSVGRYNQLQVGENICKAGRTTGRTCGEILDTDFAPAAVPNSQEFIQTDYCAEGGDSGAGVYVLNRAHGMHSGGSTGDCAPGQFSYLGHIQFAERELSFDTLVAP